MKINKFVPYFMIFGCWFSLLPTPLALIGYNIWLVLIIFWIVINTVGLISMVHPIRKDEIRMLTSLTKKTIDTWIGQTLLGFISFLLCNEILVATLFLLSCIPFLLITVYRKEKLDKKRKRN